MATSTTNPNTARHCRVAAGLTLAILVATAPTQVGPPSPPPVNECSDFACEK